jgi:hypothetical protein
MRKVLVVAVVVAAVALGLFLPRGTSAPQVPDKAVRWEHAELSEGRNAGARWATAKEDIAVDTMKDLADRLKAPAGIEEGSSIHHRMRVLDRLSADGWEVVESPTLNLEPATGRYVWTFRRRLP